MPWLFLMGNCHANRVAGVCSFARECVKVTIADITEVQLQLLRKRKYAMHVIIGVMAAGFVSIYCFFYGRVCNNQNYYTSSK